MANFNPYQFANSHCSPGYSQYRAGSFSTFSSQMFSQDSRPSTNKVLYIERVKQRLRHVDKKTSSSLMSTKLIVFRALFTREILIIYVPQVRPPRLPWRKCLDIFVGQHMTRHNKKKPQCDHCNDKGRLHQFIFYPK